MQYNLWTIKAGAGRALAEDDIKVQYKGTEWHMSPATPKSFIDITLEPLPSLWVEVGSSNDWASKSPDAVTATEGTRTYVFLPCDPKAFELWALKTAAEAIVTAADAKVAPIPPSPAAGIVYVAGSQGRWGIKSPYNAKFVAELKSLIPSAKWGGTSKAWFFDADDLPRVEKLVATYFAAPTTKQRVTWELNRDCPEIDGAGIMNVGRDGWSWKQNPPVKFQVVEIDVHSGGSVKNPGMYGKLVIDVELREGAVISPKPVSIEPVS